MPRKHGGYDSVREAILAAAALRFTETGVHGASLNDIAAAARLSKGTLYYYYPTKEQLVADIAESAIAKTTDAIFTWVDSLEREESQRGALLRLTEDLTRDEGAMRLHVVLCAEAATGNQALAQLISAAYREWTVMLEVGILKLKSQNSRLVHVRAQLFFAALDGYMLQHPGGLTDLDRKTLVEQIF